MGEFGGLGLFLIVAIAFPFMVLAPARILQYHVGYFRYALAFLLFDVETVFLYPWAVSFNRLGLFAFLEMFVFLGILALGLWYAWRKGDLAWK